MKQKNSNCKCQIKVEQNQTLPDNKRNLKKKYNVRDDYIQLGGQMLMGAPRVKTEQQHPHTDNILEDPDLLNWETHSIHWCSAPQGGLPVEEGCVSSEGWERLAAKADWPSFSPSDFFLSTTGTAMGSTGCRICWICRFLARCGCWCLPCDFFWVT